MPRKKFVPHSEADLLGYVLASADRHRVLLALNNGPFGVAEIRRTNVIDLTRISRALKQLSGVGLVTRSNTISGKGAMWMLTPKGRVISGLVSPHQFPSPPRKRPR